jgi:lipid-A-disaccharide synthase
VWIWRAIAPFIARSFDAILTSFPDEHAVYGRAGARTGTAVTFVGHYLCETLSPRTPAEQAAGRRRHGLPETGQVVGLLPGSRVHEVDKLTGILLDAASRLLEADGDLSFILPVAEPLFEGSIRKALARRSLTDKVVLCNDSHEAMRAADVVVLASGTASLEAALLGVPMVIVYIVSALTVAVIRTTIALGLIESETVGLPNLILGRAVVPELRQSRATAQAVAREASRLLGDSRAREAMRNALLEVGPRISSPRTIDRVADATLALVGARGASLATSAQSAKTPGAVTEVPGAAEEKS